MPRFSLRSFLVIFTTFLFALMLSVLPFPSWLHLLLPQWVVLVLIYWVLALPHRVNIGIAWLVGLGLDSLYGSLLGEHALALTLVAFIVERFYRQIRMFPILQQAICIMSLVLIYQLVLIWIQGMLGLLTNDTYLFLVSALTSMLFWPWLFFLLRASRRRFSVY